MKRPTKPTIEVGDRVSLVHLHQPETGRVIAVIDWSAPSSRSQDLLCRVELDGTPTKIVLRRLSELTPLAEPEPADKTDEDAPKQQVDLFDHSEISR